MRGLAIDLLKLAAMSILSLALFLAYAKYLGPELMGF